MPVNQQKRNSHRSNKLTWMNGLYARILQRNRRDKSCDETTSKPDTEPSSMFSIYCSSLSEAHFISINFKITIVQVVLIFVDVLR